MRRPLRTWLVLGFLTAPAGAFAQDAQWDPARTYASRESLERLERRFDAAANSPAYSPTVRAEARQQAERIRTRLKTGDFQTGDRIFLLVEREVALTDTFLVAEGAQLILPTLGPVSLAGVLRAEVEPHLRAEVARYVREPVVRVRTFIRVSVLGGVSRPGFYVVPTDMLMADALSTAAGFSPTARPADISIRRDNRTVVEGPAIQLAIAEGRTVDQLDIRSGDQIIVGGGPAGPGIAAWYMSLQTITALAAIPFTIVGLIALF